MSGGTEGEGPRASSLKPADEFMRVHYTILSTFTCIHSFHDQ